MGIGNVFIAVGENIHCTRIFKVGGKYAAELPEGGGVINYTRHGQKKQLPVPQVFLDSGDWEKGKVKHAAAAMWQGMYGSGSEKEAGIDYLKSMAEEQEEQDASFLDLNVDEFSTDVEERQKLIQWAAEVIQSASKLPLSIDSSNLEILEAGLRACDKSRGKPMVNSISLERIEAVPMAYKAGAVVIAGATGKDSMPESTEDRMENIRGCMKALKDEGFNDEDIYIDPLVFPISVDSKNGKKVIDSISQTRKEFGKGIHFAPGLSNVSFGLPKRKNINQVFTYLCMENGLDGGIVDPKQINLKIMRALDTGSDSFKLTKSLLLGEDEFGMNYIQAARDGKI
ncbi:MAG: dihydropteroate synthase [Spirochaetia bacterium]